MRTTDLAFADSPAPDADLTPAERLHEVAAILARGVLRLRLGGHTSPHPVDAFPPKEVVESRRNCLEGAAPSRPDPPRG